MNIEEIEIKIEENYKNINDAKKRIDELMSKAPELSIVKIGDKVQCNGYAYNGMYMQVYEVVYDKNRRYVNGCFIDSRFVAYGKIINNNGDLGKLIGKHFFN